MPLEDLSWCLVATADAFSELNIDADGASTAIVILETDKESSGKWWIIGSPNGEEGDMLTTHAIPKQYSSSRSNVDYYDYEAVWLVPGDML